MITEHTPYLPLSFNLKMTFRIGIMYVSSNSKLSQFGRLTCPFRGGGIGGLVLAVALSRMDLEELIQVDIYESAPQLTQIGAGITLWPRAWKILEKLGLDTALIGQLSPGQHIPDGKPREEGCSVDPNITQHIDSIL